MRKIPAVTSAIHQEFENKKNEETPNIMSAIHQAFQKKRNQEILDVTSAAIRKSPP